MTCIWMVSIALSIIIHLSKVGNAVHSSRPFCYHLSTFSSVYIQISVSIQKAKHIDPFYAIFVPYLTYKALGGPVYWLGSGLGGYSADGEHSMSLLLPTLLTNLQGFFVFHCAPSISHWPLVFKIYIYISQDHTFLLCFWSATCLCLCLKIRPNRSELALLSQQPAWQWMALWWTQVIMVGYVWASASEPQVSF